MFNFDNKIVVVTGASRGIGRTIAEAFHEAGAIVAICSRQHEDIDEQISKMAVPNKNEVYGKSADMSCLESIKHFMKSVVDKFGRIDILINNAGVQFPKPSLNVTEEDWNSTLNINLKGYFFASQLAAGDMVRRQASGNIVNIGSVQGTTVVIGQAAYSATKAGISQMTKSLAREWGQYGIRTNCIGPGSIPTAINAELFQDPAAKKAIIDKIPLGRQGTATEVANVTLFVASDYASYITGQTLYVDGGLTLFHG